MIFLLMYAVEEEEEGDMLLRRAPAFHSRCGSTASEGEGHGQQLQQAHPVGSTRCSVHTL